MGIKAVIFGIKSENSILDAVSGNTGTICPAQKSDISARNKWLASGSLIKGKLQIDEGAVKALLNRHSLLAVGVSKIIVDFESGEVIEILNSEKMVVAVAKSKIDSSILKQIENKQNLEIAHADDIVLI
jgi:glutamate 5-kinase